MFLYWSFQVFCFLRLLSAHVCDTLLADRRHCSATVPRLIMDWVCRTHLTLKAYQLHSGWQPPYPQSIIPTKRRSSCWGNHALSVLLKGHFNISICEWIALNCLTQHNPPILCHCLNVKVLQGFRTIVLRQSGHNGSKQISAGCKSEIQMIELCVKQLRELCVYLDNVQHRKGFKRKNKWNQNVGKNVSVVMNKSVTTGQRYTSHNEIVGFKYMFYCQECGLQY